MKAIMNVWLSIVAIVSIMGLALVLYTFANIMGDPKSALQVFIRTVIVVVSIPTTWLVVKRIWHIDRTQSAHNSKSIPSKGERIEPTI